MKKWLKWSGVVVAVYLVYVLAANVYIAANGPGEPKANSASVACNENAGELLGYINSERSKLGAPKLVIDSGLAQSSRQKLDDMISKEYYGHNSPSGGKFYEYLRSQGENAALSEDLDENGMSASGDWTAFLNSKAHFESLTDPQYTRVGIAAECTNYTIKTGTGPDDNSSLVGTKAQSLVVVQLASPKVAPPATQQVSTGSQCFTTYTTPQYIAGEYFPGRAKTTCY